MTAEETRSLVLQKFRSVAKSHGVELVGAQIKPKSESVGELLNNKVGYWKNKGDYQKPRRWLFHIFPDESHFELRFPEHASHRVLGAISTTSENERKGVVTFRLFPLVKIGDEDFRPYPAWDWLFWVAFKTILSPSLGNSAVVRNLDLKNGTVEIGGKKQAIAQTGILGLCPQNEILSLLPKPKIKYGEVTAKLAQLVKHDSLPIS